MENIYLDWEKQPFGWNEFYYKYKSKSQTIIGVLYAKWNHH